MPPWWTRGPGAVLKTVSACKTGSACGAGWAEAGVKAKVTLPPPVAPEASIVPLLSMPLVAVNVTLPPLPALEAAVTLPDWLIASPA